MRLTDEQVAALARDPEVGFIRALASDLLESRAALAAKDAEIEMKWMTRPWAILRKDTRLAFAAPAQPSGGTHDRHKRKDQGTG